MFRSDYGIRFCLREKWARVRVLAGETSGLYSSPFYHEESENRTRSRRITMGHPVFKDKSEWFSVPFDPRFPNTNQTKHCYQNYLDFQRCKKKRGEEFSACQYFKKAFKVICPASWTTKWDEQIEAGTFPSEI